MLYRPDDQEVLNARNDIFLVYGEPVLKGIGFERAPYREFWYGKDEHGEYEYSLMRLRSNEVDFLRFDVIRGNGYIHPTLNIFELEPPPTKLSELAPFDGLKFVLSPLNRSAERIGPKGKPVSLRIKKYYTRAGYEKQLRGLGEALSDYCKSIDQTISHWKQRHVPEKTDWEGNRLER